MLNVTFNDMTFQYPYNEYVKHSWSTDITCGVIFQYTYIEYVNCVEVYFVNDNIQFQYPYSEYVKQQR